MKNSSVKREEEKIRSLGQKMRMISMKPKGLTIHAGGYHNFGGYDFYGPEESWEMGFEFLKKYLQFPVPIEKLDHFELKNIAFLGPMASGKSTQIRSLMKFAVDSFPGQVNYFMTDSIDMGVAHADLRPLQLICIDDAASQNDSRLSGGTKRATQTQGYFVIRHDMKDRVQDLINEKRIEVENLFLREIERKKALKQIDNKNAGGVIFIIWSFQHYTSIDTRYREFFDAIFIKSYSRDRNIKKLLNNNQEMLDLLKEITRENIYNNYEARRLSVGTTKAEDLLVLVTDYISEKDFKIPEHYGDSLMDEYIEELYSTLLEQPLDLLSSPKEVIYGYFHTNYSDDPEYQKYHINKAIIGELIERMRYEKKNELEFYKRFGFAPEYGKTQGILDMMNQSFLDLENILKNKQVRFELTQRLRNEDISWRKCGNILSVNHATLYSEFEQLNKNNEFKSKKKPHFELSSDELNYLNPEGWDAVFRIMVINSLSLYDIIKTTGLSEEFIKAQYLMWCSTVQNLSFTDNIKIQSHKLKSTLSN
jgi:hypothetical protein